MANVVPASQEDVLFSTQVLWNRFCILIDRATGKEVSQQFLNDVQLFLERFDHFMREIFYDEGISTLEKLTYLLHLEEFFQMSATKENL